MTTISLSKAAPHKTRADALVVGVVKDGTDAAVAPGAEAVAGAFGRSFAATCRSLGVKGSVGEVTKLPGNGAVKAPLVVLVGLGDSADVTPEAIRRAVGSAVRSLPQVETVALAVPADTSARACAVAEGVLLGGYAFTRYLSDEYGMPGWWTQTVAVGYERVRGMRAKYQTASGFQVSVSKTFPVGVKKLARSFEDARRRSRWLEAGTLKLRTSRKGTSARYDFQGGGRVMAYFESKGPKKSTLSIQHERLGSARAVEDMRAFWKERLGRLAETLKA